MSGWHTTSRQSRGYGKEWDRIRPVILRRDRYLCQCSECKRLHRIRPAHEVDHVIPKGKGGTDDPANLQAINRNCHKEKTAKENGASTRPTIGTDGYPIGGGWSDEKVECLRTGACPRFSAPRFENRGM